MLRVKRVVEYGGFGRVVVKQFGLGFGLDQIGSIQFQVHSSLKLNSATPTLLQLQKFNFIFLVKIHCFFFNSNFSPKWVKC